VTAGRYNPLLVRFVDMVLEDNGVQFQINTYGGGAGANYYFKGFDRGWYCGGLLEYGFSTYSVKVDGDGVEGRLQTVLLTPNVGYKYIGATGFTFGWELGVGYQGTFGNKVTVGSATAEAPADSGLRVTSSLFLGWSF